MARADTETFRQRWPEILDAVRDERRVAWILLRNTSAESVEGSVLTVAFASEGEARSFASSGHEAVLAGIVASLLGVNVRIRPVAAGAGSAGAGSAGSVAARPASGPPAPSAPPRANPPAGRAAAGTGTAGGGTGTTGSGTGTAASGTGTTGGGSQATPGRPGTTPGGARPGGAAGHPAPPAPGTGRGSRLPGATGKGAARPVRQPGTATPPPADSVDDEPWPDEEGDPGEPSLSGMELIARQLGGQVIEEIEDS